MQKNNITVFTITYNCDRYIYRCYNSILNQSYPNWLWLIIDDGSNDNTENIIKDLNDTRIQYYKIKDNIGRGKARNFGLTKIQTNWLAILDMDDLMLKSRLKRFNTAINRGFDGLISSTLLIDNNLKINGIRKVIYNKYFNLFTHATLCINTKTLKDISYSESRYAEDQRVLVLVSRNCNLDICEEPLYVYQEDASINIQGAYLSNYYAFINLKSIISFSNYKTIRLNQLLYISKFLIYTICLYFLSNLLFGNLIYNKLIQRRVKEAFENDSIKNELNSYE